MKNHQPKSMTIPSPRTTTVRQSICSLLRNEPLSAREISEQVGIREREVCEHLEHIRQSLRREGHRLTVQPAECRNCGFLFVKRERLKRPGRCPLCKGESISQPRYRLD
jgi:predicted Zn-ribbon and HTH transcriptional regulator